LPQATNWNPIAPTFSGYDVTSGGVLVAKVLVVRGLRMLVRGERLGGWDQKVLDRPLWRHEHRNQEEEVVGR
jgi:hypothetical protein